MIKIQFVRLIVLSWFIFTILFNFNNFAFAGGDYSAHQVKSMMDDNKPLFLLNPLSEIEFNEAHIPGSVNIPLHKIMKTDKLPRNKDMLIITYCKGPK